MATFVPNLVVIGAQKSGTTSLHSVLGTHPDIFMSSPVKEPTYFLPVDNMRRRLHNYGFTKAVDHDSLLQHYMLKGYRGEAFFGEASTSYTNGDDSRRLGIPARIKEQSPDARLIYILRNPFGRIMSVLRHMLDRYDRDLLQENASRQDFVPHIALATSRYHYQLCPYLELFDRARIHLASFERFTDDQDSVTDEIFDFLGLPGFRPQERIRSNVSSTRSAEIRQKIPRAILNHIYEPIVDDMQTLQQMTGYDITRWDLSFDTWCDD